MLATQERGEYKSLSPGDEPSDAGIGEEAAMIEGLTPKKRSSLPFSLFTIICSSVLLFLYSVVLMQITRHVSSSGRSRGTRFMKSLANDFIQYEPRVFHQFERPWQNVTYVTTPSDEVDRNWHNLVQHQNIRIPRQVMQEMGRLDEGIELPTGDYFGSIMVFHHLHCLKNLYHALHPEYYNLTAMSPYERGRFAEHNEHCLHMLREAVMCQADTTLLTMKWNTTGLRPVGNLTSPHECVNWDRLMEWVVPNSFDAFDDGVLVHPIFGPVFRDRQFADGAPL